MDGCKPISMREQDSSPSSEKKWVKLCKFSGEVTPDNTHLHYLRPRNLSTRQPHRLLTPPLALNGKKWQLRSPRLYQLELLFVEMSSVRHANFSASSKPYLWTKLELKIVYFETTKSCRNVLCCSLVLFGIAHSRMADCMLYKHNLHKCFRIFCCYYRYLWCCSNSFCSWIFVTNLTLRCHSGKCLSSLN